MSVSTPRLVGPDVVMRAMACGRTAAYAVMRQLGGRKIPGVGWRVSEAALHDYANGNAHARTPRLIVAGMQCKEPPSEARLFRRARSPKWQAEFWYLDVEGAKRRFVMSTGIYDDGHPDSKETAFIVASRMREIVSSQAKALREEPEPDARLKAAPALSKRLRFDILKRDNFRCRYCGRAAPGATLHVDHVRSRKDGGTNEPSNLTTACQDCNLGKSSRSLELHL